MLKYNGLYITFCDDCDKNIGGYFCQIYNDENLENEIDNFVIPKDECYGDLSKAEEFAKDYIDMVTIIGY